MDALIITDIELKTIDEEHELTALVDGDVVRFRTLKQHDLYSVADCFVGVALLEAMITNRKIVVQGQPVSKKLVDNFKELQSVYACWNSDLNIVDIEAEVTDKDLGFENVGSFFSAGIDSTHTLLRHIDEITHLVIFNEFDSGNQKDEWNQRIARQEEFAKSINKTLIPVQSNAIEWNDNRRIASEFSHGLFLSSFGGVLGMKKMFVPASHTYDELFPWGSHPLTDPMWSTDSTEVVHDGAECRRTEKTEQILINPALANNLQVCWKTTGHNCGECPKCVRTMLAVYLLGGEIESLKKLNDLELLKVLKPRDENSAVFLEDLILLAKKVKNDDVYKVLKSLYKSYKASELIPLFDKYLLRNFAKNLHRKFNNPEWINWRITMGGPKDKQI